MDQVEEEISIGDAISNISAINEAKAKAKGNSKAKAKAKGNSKSNVDANTNDSNRKNDNQQKSTINNAEVGNQRMTLQLFCDDVISNVLSYLQWQEIVGSRLISQRWRAAASCCRVEEQLVVDDHPSLASNLRKISRCLPALQSLKIQIIHQPQSSLHSNHKNRNDTDLENSTERGLFAPHFFNLLHLSIQNAVMLNFMMADIVQLSCLRSLNLQDNEVMQWKLSDLSSLLVLQELRCINNRNCTGDVQDLLVPSSRKLRTVDISGCTQVTGNLMDFAHIDTLEGLGLSRTSVMGDLRDLRAGHHFVSLQIVGLDHQKIYGAREFHSVCHADAIMRNRLQLTKQSAEECPIYPFQVGLSRESPEYHERIEQRLYISERDPPFDIEQMGVKSNGSGGGRLGWRWTNNLGGVCSVHWIDPEPQPGDAEYKIYVDQLVHIQFEDENSLFSGFMEPPTREEYIHLCSTGL